MPTLDYAKDLIELFQKNQKEYVIVIVQPTKNGKKKIITFYKIEDKGSAELAGNSLHYIAEQLLGQPPQGSGKITVEKPKKKPRS